MCASDPDCFAFDNKGMLYRKGSLVDDPDSTIFMKN